MTAPAVVQRQATARELYGQGMSLRQVADRLGVSHMTVKRDLQDCSPRSRRHLTVVRSQPRRSPPPAVRVVPPEASAIAFTADRGWHMVQAPPGWFLELLAELD